MSFAVAATVYYGVVEPAQSGVQAQKDAMNKAEDRARKNALLQDQEMNKMNQKKPDIFGMLRANQLAGMSGLPSTSLTGAGGVDPNTLKLGKSTLLGM